MKYIAMLGAFVLVHIIIGWLFWAGGMDFTVRGPVLGAYATGSMLIGILMSYTVHEFWPAS